MSWRPHPPVMHGASEAIAWTDCKRVQAHYGEGDISGETCDEESVMGRRVLDGRLPGGDGWGTRRLGSGRALRSQPGQATRRVATSTRVILIPRVLGAG